MSRIGAIGLSRVLRRRRVRGWGVGAPSLTAALLAVACAHGIADRAVSAARAGPRGNEAAPLPPAQPRGIRDPAGTQIVSPIRLVTGGAAEFVFDRRRDLDRVAAAVDGAESNYGTNPGMWRADPLGPQGPMQVSAAAAADVGGGDRFDVNANLALGRAYLARMYDRYGSWADAVAAYNWGPAHLDAWISGGRRAEQLPAAVERYTGRVLLASSGPGMELPMELVMPPLSAPRFMRHTGRRSLRARLPRHIDPRDPVQLLYGAVMQRSAAAR
jgi:hypothetical protein